ncbi:MAG: hypothetical protein Q9214_001186 [Letrouitia sp. 1 TL-2023]
MILGYFLMADPIGTPIGITASFAAVFQLTATVINYINNFKDASQDRLRLRDELSSACFPLYMLKERLDQTDQDVSQLPSVQVLSGLNGPISQFKRQLEQLAAKIVPNYGKKNRVDHITTNITWPFKKEEVRTLLNAMERQKSLFHLALQNDIMSLTQAIKEETSGLPALADNVEVIREHLKYLHTNDNAGAGKTILTSIAVEHIRETHKDRLGNKVGVACIYCNYKEQHVQSPLNLIASVWMQLVQGKDIVSDKVKSIYEGHFDKGTRPNLKKVYEILQAEVQKYEKVFVLLDALDECTNDYCEILVDQLRALRPKINLMTTSRRLDNVARIFSEAPMLEINAQPTDVRTYVTNRIARGSRLLRHVESDKYLAVEIRENVVKTSANMFLLAQLHMDSLVSKTSRKSVRQALGKLPKDLDATYEEAMLRIENQDDDDKKLAKKVLYWISFAVRPLLLDELRDAVAVEPDMRHLDEDDRHDEGLLTSVCAGLVVVDQTSQIVRLCHYSTEEYLNHTRTRKFPEAQLNITKTCLTYLQFHEFARGPLTEDEAFSRIKEYPLLSYAAINWGKHLQGPSEQLVQEIVLKFLNSENSLRSSVQCAHLTSSYRIPQSYPQNVMGLHVSAQFGLKHITKVLLSQGSNIAARDSNGRNALIIAASNGHKAVVELLLDSGDDITAKDERGWTALHVAARGGHKAIVELLLTRGADIMAREMYGWTSLHVAARDGHEAIIELLLDNGADIMAEAKFGWTVLHTATTSGSKAIVSLLLRKGASISKGMDVSTALHIAANFGYTRFATTPRRDTDKKTEPIWGSTPWMAAKWYQDIAEVLFDCGRTVEAHFENFLTTLLYEAIKRGHAAVMEVLCELRASVKWTSDKDWTPLHEAVRRSSRRIVEILLERGAGLQALTNATQKVVYDNKDSFNAIGQLEEEEASLLLTIYKASTLTSRLITAGLTRFELLLAGDYGIDDIDIKNGESALHKAARRGDIDCVHWLLDHGANPKFTNRHGQDATQIALASSKGDVVALFSSYKFLPDPIDDHELEEMLQCCLETLYSLIRDTICSSGDKLPRYRLNEVWVNFINSLGK